MTNQVLYCCWTISLFFLYTLPSVAQTWQTNLQKADSLYQKRHFTLAKPMYEKLLPQIEKDSTQMSTVYLRSRNKLGSCLLYESTKDSISIFLLQNEALTKKFGEKTKEYATALYNLGCFYLPSLKGNDVQKAEQYLKKVEILRKKIVGENHIDYLNILNVLATLYMELENYGAAESLYLKIIPICKNILGENNESYAIYAHNFAVLYMHLGNYATAEKLFIQALSTQEKVGGANSPSCAVFASNLAVLYSDMGNYTAAEIYYTKALNVYHQTVGETDLDYINSLSNLAALHFTIGNYAKSEALYLKALDLYKKVIGENHAIYALTLGSIASLYQNMGKYAVAEQTNLQALRISQTVRAEKHSDNLACMLQLATLYQTENDNKKALPYYLKSINQNQYLTQQNFSFLSESEKTEYFNNKMREHYNFFNSFAIAQQGLNAQLYNLQLFSKGILLNSTQKMKNRILNSKDSVVINEYKIWNNLKLALAKYQQMSQEEFAETGLQLDSLEKVVNQMEKSLARKSEAFAKISEQKISTWKDIQQQLKTDEAAIEIIRISKFGVQKTVTDTTDWQANPKGFQNPSGFPKYPVYGLTDTVYYAALIVKKKSKEPELVLLTNGNELENLAFKKYRSKALYRVEDKESYAKYWLPIQKKLGKTKKVYLSPDGIFNQVNLNILKNPVNQQYVLDEIEIEQLTNTREILAFQSPKTLQELKNHAAFKAVLFGRPAYDMDSVTYLVNQELSKATNNAYALRDIRDLQKGNFSDLLGTEKEIEVIESLLKTNHVTTEKYLLHQATEQRIKSLENPSILHIATHGFFIADSTTKNPMLNSGVLLAGVSNYYRSAEKPDIDDGILTAHEAQNLALDYTDLVVLSACETALGEVRHGEGVYGLQRAFKAAGAKSILMSHWKVDDRVTQELMTTFYANWLKMGNKRQAFLAAQQDIRKKYPQPFFWGAFVMVGE